MESRTQSARIGLTVLREAMTYIVRRPLRSVLTMSGTILGVGLFVATSGFAASLEGRVSTVFDELRVTEVRLKDVHAGGTTLSLDVDRRLTALNGVITGGVAVRRSGLGRVVLRPNLYADPVDGVPVFGATPGFLGATRPRVSGGVTYDVFHEARAEPVALLGRNVAERLGLVFVPGHTTAFIEGREYAVVGVLDGVSRYPELMDAVVLPLATAQRDFQDLGAGEVLVDVAPGAASMIAAQAPLALAPEDPSRFEASHAPEPASLRRRLEASTARFLLVLSGSALAAGCISIANTSLLSVLERRREVGIRRALGASRAHVAVQFLSEAGLLGVLGGVVGAAVAVLAVSAVAVLQGWTMVLPPGAPGLGIAAGALSGLLAGLYPSLRAGRLDPAEAVRES